MCENELNLWCSHAKAFCNFNLNYILLSLLTITTTVRKKKVTIHALILIQTEIMYVAVATAKIVHRFIRTLFYSIQHVNNKHEAT